MNILLTTLLGCSSVEPVAADAGPDATATDSGDGAARSDAASCSYPDASSRDPLVWPFASTSIWNIPIGTSAVYAPANIAPVPLTTFVLQADQDRIVMKPCASPTPLLLETVDWGAGDRCQPLLDGGVPTVIDIVPFPSSYIVAGDHHNNGAAFLMPDGHTVVQTQPLSHCTDGGPATSHWVWDGVRAVDLFGDGITGAHGGSGLSALGGTLRLGELGPTSSFPKHALKIDLDGSPNLYPCGGGDAGCTQCYRWPAVAGECSSASHGTTPGVVMGSLLALPPNFDKSSAYGSLTTAPARQLAHTLMYYGAYIVDDTNAASYGFAVEDGPDGSFLQQFLGDWGFNFNPAFMTSHAPNDQAWAKDILVLFGALELVANNTDATRGGGGTPLQPLAPPL